MSVLRLATATVGVSGVYVQACGAVVGPKEGEGPLGQEFDRVWPDEGKGYSSFEKAEQGLLQEACDTALQKAAMSWDALDVVLGGDLLDQTVTTNFVARTHERPLLGMFAACATFTEALGLAAILVGSGAAATALASASSHHLTAERQFRFPLELGYQRPPTSAWTSTAAGAVVLSREWRAIQVQAVTFGRVVDIGGKDPNDMGSAMAPAAFDTIERHFKATGLKPADYTEIVTGDLGHFGIDMLKTYASDKGVQFGDELNDCGRWLYDAQNQDTHNGGSGPGCSASVFAGPLTRRLAAIPHGRMLLVATGALFSPTTYQQGETIPCIAHAVQIASTGGDSAP